MLPERYTIDNLQGAITNPQQFIVEINRLLGSYYFKRKYGASANVMEEDWDYLLILDACRFDIFQEVSASYPRLSDPNYIISQASHSREFMDKTFSKDQYHDTVYVTANGYGAQVNPNTFHDLIFTDHNDYTGETGVTHPSWKGLDPSTVHNAALEAYEEYPQKRMIIHFMQPHNPYFGDRAEELQDRLRKEGVIVTQRKKIETEHTSQNGDEVVKSLEHAAESGFITPSELREVYIENLEIVLSYVRSLLDELEGKTVITADHGELLGEKTILSRKPTFGHKEYVYRKELRRVPWSVVETGNRPEITEEEPTESTETDEDTIDDRLAALGYKG